MNAPAPMARAKPATSTTAAHSPARRQRRARRHPQPLASGKSGGDMDNEETDKEEVTKEEVTKEKR